MTGPAPMRDAGFTLLELLVAVTLLSFLTILTVQGLRMGSRSWASVDRRTLHAANVRAVQDVFRRAIGNAYPAFVYSDLTDRRIAFAGDRQTLAIVTPLPEAIEAGVMARERFFVAKDGPGFALFEDWQLNLPPSDDETVPGENRVKLVDSIRAVRFSYFGSPSYQQAPEWLDQWIDRPAPPILVRIQIEQKGPDRPRWPDLIVQPRVTANTACLYDPATIECRRIR